MSNVPMRPGGMPPRVQAPQQQRPTQQPNVAEQSLKAAMLNRRLQEYMNRPPTPITPRKGA